MRLSTSSAGVKSFSAESPREVLPRQKLFLPALFLFISVFVVYLPALRNQFVNFDDPQYVTSNAQARNGISWTGLQWALTSGEAANWHPVTWISHMLDCQLFGQRPWGHHLTGILIHATNVLLAFLVFTKLTNRVWRSFAVAALFGLHPLRVESVAWVSERKDVLSGLFWMLTLWAYVNYGRGLERREREKSEIRNSKSEGSLMAAPQNPALWYCLTLLFVALGLMSKPMLVTIPFALLLLDYWPLARWKRADKNLKKSGVAGLVLEKIPFFALAAISSAVTLVVQKHGGAVKTVTALPLDLRLENTVISYFRYILKIVWPANLSVFYPFPEHWPTAYVLGSGLVVMGLSLAALLAIRTRPYFFAGWFWFVGTLVPVIGLVQVGDQSLADRYTYIPSIGLLIAFIWGISEVAAECARLGRSNDSQLSQLRSGLQRALAPACAVALCLCAGLTWRQISYWKDSETLFFHALAIEPNNSVAHLNLGWAFAEKRMEDQALIQYAEAVRLAPQDASAHCNFATTLMVKRRLDEAIQEFEKSVRLNPNDPGIHNNFGSALVRKGRIKEAIRQFQAAMQLAPQRSELHCNLADALAQDGQFEEAVTHFQKALTLNANYPGLQFKLAMTLVQLNRLDDAIPHFRLNVKHQPDDANGYYFLGGALLELQRIDEAIECYDNALRLRPNSVPAHMDVARALEMKGRTADSVVHLKRAIELEPNGPEAHNALGAALANAGQVTEAAVEFKEALRLKPDFAAAQSNLEKIRTPQASKAATEVK